MSCRAAWQGHVPAATWGRAILALRLTPALHAPSALPQEPHPPAHQPGDFKGGVDQRRAQRAGKATLLRGWPLRAVLAALRRGPWGGTGGGTALTASLPLCAPAALQALIQPSRLRLPVWQCPGDSSAGLPYLVFR